MGARRNLIAGMLLLSCSLLVGAFMSSARDITWVQDLLKWPPIRRNQVMYAHAHLGVLGLVNVAIGLILPTCRLRHGLRTAASWAAIFPGILVPAGMLFALLPAPWEKLVYLQAAGFALAMFATAATAWGQWASRTDVHT